MRRRNDGDLPGGGGSRCIVHRRWAPFNSDLRGRICGPCSFDPADGTAWTAASSVDRLHLDGSARP